jgi:hypothetical protein
MVLAFTGEKRRMVVVGRKFILFEIFLMFFLRNPSFVEQNDFKETF